MELRGISGISGFSSQAALMRARAAVTDALEADSLFLFLPGTGTPTTRVGSLLSAAADMGHHAIALSYAMVGLRCISI